MLNLRRSYFHVQEQDDGGVWILDQREDGDHLVLVKWEHIKALDIVKGDVKAVGPIN